MRECCVPAEAYFQFLNPLTFLLFAAGLFSTHVVKPSPSALVLAQAYLVGAAAFAVDILNTAFPPFFGVIPTTSLYALCAVLISGGLCLRYNGRAPWRALAAVAVVHMAIYSYCHLALENHWIRSIEANVGCAVIFAIGVFCIPFRQRRMIDRVIVALFALNVVQCLLRPAIVVWLSGGELSQETYSASIFLVTMQFVAGVFAIMTGMALLVAYSTEIIEELHERSMRDPLSGLLNRRGFEDEAAALLENADRFGAPVGVIIADIDCFKQINDSNGHAFGDIVIAELGAVIATYAVDGRVAGRIGGEEFAILLPGETGAEARELAEAIRRDVQSISVDSAAGSTAFTASFGAAERRNWEDLRIALTKADEALYLAKARGRNCVMGEADVGVEKLKQAQDLLERRTRRAVHSSAESSGLKAALH